MNNYCLVGLLYFLIATGADTLLHCFFCSANATSPCLPGCEDLISVSLTAAKEILGRSELKVDYCYITCIIILCSNFCHLSSLTT